MQNVISKIENTLETNFHAKVYSMMTVMLLMTGVIGCLSVYFGLAKTFITHPILFTLLMISELAVVTVLTSKFLKNHDFNTNLLLANTYAGLSGLTFSIGLNVYKPTTLLLGLSATIAVFVLATLYGLFTKRNINSIGGWILLYGIAARRGYFD
jgi:FtsH-binding integral membrane protein